ncbi:MAG: DnaJ domain-containing protein [Myxococcales bacterium]|nr:DnaJ domain-containing protein [Myxococcales bacterium]
MAAVPAEIPGIGATSLRLVPNPVFNPMEATPALSSQDFYVLSRFDGTTTLKDLILMTGFPADESIAIILKLRQMRAILLPGEVASASTTMPPPNAPRTATPAASRPRTATPAAAVPRTATPAAAVPRTATPSVASSSTPSVPRTATAKGVHVSRTVSTNMPRSALPSADLPIAKFDTPTMRGPELPNTTIPPAEGEPWTAKELAAFREPNELSMEQRALILRYLRLVGQGNRFALLGVAPDASKQDIKRAFFRLSKELHPDRYYGKQLGEFATHLSVVFVAISRAYEGPAGSGALAQGTTSGAAQSASEHAAELYERACQTEIAGDAAGALNLFRAAVRLTPTAKYLRRAAMCALTAGQVASAEEFARKGVAVDPADVSMQRLLAQAFRDGGKLAEAEEVLVMAMAMRSENDVLGGELRNDLQQVQRLLNS